MGVLCVSVWVLGSEGGDNCVCLESLEECSLVH